MKTSKKFFLNTLLLECNTMGATEAVIIPDRGEFIDVLKHLRRGSVLARAAADDPRCVVDGAMYYTALPPLLAYGLLQEVKQADPESRLHCYRLSGRGHAFAEKACEQWKRTPLLQKLAVRLAG
jgi:hypothetical protein